jgi:hypothetical protein
MLREPGVKGERTMLRRMTVLAAIALFAWAAPLVAREELVDPPPIAVPESLAIEDVAAAIKAAMLGRGWTVMKQRPGRIDATLFLRTHVANIEIAFDREQIVLAYKSSENLDYKESRGRRVIHDNYLGWTQNLVNDIRRHVHNAANP